MSLETTSTTNEKEETILKVFVQNIKPVKSILSQIEIAMKKIEE